MYTQEKATKFLLNIYFRGNDHLSNAVNRAYRDMNRTISFINACDKTSKENKENRKKLIEKVKKIIAAGIRNSNIKNFDDWHCEICRNIQLVYINDVQGEKGLTYGQAQKWINMTLKYLTIINQLENIDVDYKNFITNHGRDFHVPVDTIILDSFEEEYKNSKAIPNSGTNKKRKCWSKWNEDEYKSFQDYLKNNISGYESLLDWEFEKWTPRYEE